MDISVCSLARLNVWDWRCYIEQYLVSIRLQSSWSVVTWLYNFKIIYLDYVVARVCRLLQNRSPKTMSLYSEVDTCNVNWWRCQPCYIYTTHARYKDARWQQISSAMETEETKSTIRHSRVGLFAFLQTTSRMRPCRGHSQIQYC